MKRPEAFEEFKALIRQSLQRQLDIKITEIEEEMPFLQLGLDSEGAVELVADINDALDSKFSASVIFDHPCVSELARHLWKLQPGVTPAHAVPMQSAPGRVALEDKGADRAVAIIGVSGRYPGADDLEQFWHNLEQGVDSVKEIPA